MPKTYKKKPLSLKIKQGFNKFLFTHYGTLRVLEPWDKFTYWFKYTFIRPRNIVKIPTLESGHYIDYTEVMLHVNFAMLVDFIEWELPRYRKCKNLEDCLINIEEEKKSLTETGYTEEDMKPIIADHEKQNDRYRLLFKLYNWWKIERPNRKELEMPPSLKEKTDNLDSLFKFEPIEDSKNEYGEPQYFELKSVDIPGKAEYYEQCHKQEIDWYDEDNKNLSDLVSLRENLWT
jgi:hypothetical protein